MKKQFSMKLRGLSLTRHEGELISINNGEMLIGITEARGGMAKIVFHDPTRKFKIDRFENVSDKPGTGDTDDFNNFKVESL